jgi:D-alanine-D-alanine ligase
MAQTKKIRVAVVYGGRSGEHEISLISAASVIRNLDRTRFEILPIGIDKQGKWHFDDLKMIEGAKALTIRQAAQLASLEPFPHSEGKGVLAIQSLSSNVSIDVVFPVMHGPLCEDGTIQGFFELAEIPYVGNGVLSSAIGMDKEVAKRLARDAGIPVVPWVSVKRGAFKKDFSGISERVARELGYPVFVKPANMGSSLGVHKVKTSTELQSALEDAFLYDTKVLIEKSVNAREIEMSALESPRLGDEPLISVPGEIVPTHEFYSYESKYLDENGAALHIPAKLSAAQIQSAQKMGRDVFLALECEGLARVDLFLDKVSGEWFLNEINTMPGFTQISMYPKLWEASGISYTDLLTRLIDLAMARAERKRALKREK